MDDIEEWSGCSYIQLKDICHKTGSSGEERQLRTCNGTEYQVKFFLSMPIYAFHGAILGGISAGGYAVYCYLNGVHNYLHR